MDKSTTPAESDGGGTEQDFGATGVFGTAKASDAEERPADPGEALSAWGNRAPQAAQTQTARPQPALGEKGLAEPAVHKVVFGGGAAERSPELLDQMRKASAAREREAVAEKAPASEPEIPSSGQGSGGFTQLLRKLGNEAAPPPPAAREMPAPPQPRPATDMGFTSLLQKLGTPNAAPTPPVDPPSVRQPIAKSIAEETRSFAPAPTSGSLTDMFRTMPGPSSGSASGSGLGGAETQVLRPGGAPAAATPDAARPAVAASAAPVNSPEIAPENAPGAFTKLFETFGGAGAGPAAPAPAARVPEPPREQSGSFTQMLAMEPQSQAPKPPLQLEREQSPGKLDYGLAPGTASPTSPAAANRDPFAPAPRVDLQPAPSSMQASGVGITRLISMLDQTSQAPGPARNAAPVNPPAAGGPGGLTETFATFGASGEPAPPVTKQPEWAPVQPPRTTPGATGAVASRRDYGASLTQPAMNAPTAGAGPSEFTRIMDASKMREQSMREGPAAAGGTPGAASSGAAAPPPASASAHMPMPGFQVPPAPSMGGMQGMARMPQPGAYVPQQPHVPAQVPGYPMNYGPQAGAMHAPGAGAPQMPGMYPPAPPQMPAAPQLPPLKPAEPGVGKLQQYVPLLLVVVIVLLVALLVTVIFLMKK